MAKFCIHRRISFIVLTIIFLYAHSLLGQISYEEAYPNLSFNFPVEIQNANDGSNRIFVLEQPGIIKVFPNDPSVTSSQVTTFLDLSTKVAYSSGQEIGLLGLAFHPNFNSNGYVYVYYTDRPSNYRINLVRYTVNSGNSNTANPSSELLIASFTKNQNNSNHNGGKIAFGPDGYLYISVGDGGGAYDPQGNAQNLNNIFGSFLRIDVDVDGSNPIEINPEAPDGRYEIPSDNPLVGQSGLDELYAWGIRNTWKFSFDGSTLFGADVGQDELEEINIIEKGANYGWNRFEGGSTAVSSTSLVTSPDIKPIFQYNHANGDKSITGGYVYSGAITNTSIQGKYIYGDYITGRVWALDYNQSNSTATSEFLFRANGQLISTFGVDEFGELYFSSYGSGGKIYKITDESPGPVTTEVIGVGEWDQVGIDGVNGIVETIVNDGTDNYYIGGEFTNVPGTNANNIAKYSKTNGWETFGNGTNGKVSTIAISGNGDVYVGGDFTAINGISASNVAKFDGTNWTTLGSGTDGPVSKIGIDSNNKVYVTGAFTTAGGENANNIALWENDTWNPLTDATNSISGTNNEIRSITFDENNHVYVGGNFDSAGGNSAPRIAKWNGTNWSTLGLGTSGFVQAIYIDDDYIYAGGNFAVAGSQTANRIARWNRNTLTWEAMGHGLSGNVNAITHDGSYLYVGGNFETASDVENINEIMNNISRWSESNGWEALGIETDVGVTTLVNTLSFSSDNNELLVGGNFVTAGNTSTNNIAVWGEALCTDSAITPEYQINGTWQSGSNTLSIDEGTSLVISMLPNTTNFTVTSPDTSVNNGDLNLGTVIPSQSGNYIITTEAGCQETIQLTINTVDTDNDGISETFDLCPNTPLGEPVDSNGCGESQKDDDNDGVFNNVDNCPNTPNGESVDSNGCGESQKDDDNDGVFNNIDICPNTPSTETADALGCGSSQQDIDGDGIINTEDQCNSTPAGESVNADGCAESELDDDNDGVSNADDLCPNTPNNDVVDIQGCGETQKDDDDDGVVNANDLCPNTPSNDIADTQGCGETQKDDDNDGVVNADDLCPDTPSNDVADAQGCGETQKDDDNDGVSNAEDICPNTPSSETADSQGCGPSQQDVDNDGVPNTEDLCSNTPPGENVDENGCSQTQLDTDNDGISDAIDVCPQTPENSTVDSFGCVVSPIPESTFTIKVKSNSCIGSADGVIEITSQLSLPFVARLTGISFSETSPFSEELVFSNLPAGTFELCITTSEYPDYESCSTISIETPESLSVTESIDPINGVVNLKMSGADTFFVEINGFEFKTNSKELLLNLEKGTNMVKVRTEKTCQGSFEKEINIETVSVLYPNPADEEIWISSNSIQKSDVIIKIYDMSGSMVFSKSIPSSELVNPIYISNLIVPKGIYLLLLEQETISQSFKLIKK